VSITGSIFPDANTHIELVTFGKDADAMNLMFGLMTGAGNRLTRPLRAIGEVIRHPVRFARRLWPFGWAKRTVVVGLMQNVDNALRFRAKRRALGGVRLTTEQDPLKPIPTITAMAEAAMSEIPSRVVASVASTVTARPIPAVA